MMKRGTSALLALALLLWSSALALEGFGYPSWDGTSDPHDALYGSYDGQRLALQFDTDSTYSNLSEGILQACFYATDAIDAHDIETYLLLPADLRAGDLFRSGEGTRCSVVLYELSDDGSVFYCAGSPEESPLDPAPSSYEIAIGAVENSGSALHVSGSFTAQLSRYEQDQPTSELIHIEEAHFDFTLPLTAAPSPSPSPFAEVPEFPFPTLPSDAPQESAPAFPDLPGAGKGPAFTLPPDYAEI